MSKVIKLDNGKFLLNDYGKYRPELTIIMSDDKVLNDFRISIPAKDFNLSEGDLYVVKGDFWISKKGTKVFEIKDDGKHLLIQDSWGGAFNNYRGGVIEKLPKQHYFHRASSNGGGIGNDWVIVDADSVFSMSIDDI